LLDLLSFPTHLLLLECLSLPLLGLLRPDDQPTLAHPAIGGAQFQQAISFLCIGVHVGCNGFDQAPGQSDPFRHVRQPTYPRQPLQVVFAVERTIGN